MAEPEPATDLDLPIWMLAFLFKGAGWEWDVDGELRPPEIDEILTALFDMAHELEESDDENAWTTRGRLIVHKDPDMPSYFWVSLNVGLIEREYELPEDYEPPEGGAACAA